MCNLSNFFKCEFANYFISKFLKLVSLCSLILSLSLHLNGQHSVTNVTVPIDNHYGVVYSGGSYNWSSSLLVGKCLSGTWSHYRQALYFDLSEIDTNATITACRLSFHAGSVCTSGVEEIGRIVFRKISTNMNSPSTIWEGISDGTDIDSLWINVGLTTHSEYLYGFVNEINTEKGTSPYKLGIGVIISNDYPNRGTDFFYPTLMVDLWFPTPPTVTNLTTSNITATSFTLSWSAAGGSVSGYKVYKNDVLYSTTTSTNLSITGLCPGTNYKLNVKAFNDDGDGDLSSSKYQSTPATVIAGDLILCSSGKYYSINNLPQDATIAWNKSSNIQRISAVNANPCFFQGQDWGGQGWIDVEINSATCGSIPVDSLSVWSGRPWVPTVYPSGNPAQLMGIYSPLYVAILTSPGANFWEADWSSSGSITTTCDCGSSGYFYSTSPGTGYFFVTPYNECGTGVMYQGEVWVSDSLMDSMGNENEDYLTLSPNPTTDYFDVTLDFTKQEITGTYSIMIIDAYGRVLKNFKLNGPYNRINIQDIKEGHYIIRFVYNKIVLQKSLIIGR